MVGAVAALLLIPAIPAPAAGRVVSLQMAPATDFSAAKKKAKKAKAKKEEYMRAVPSK
jgi:hypothetical protein